MHGLIDVVRSWVASGADINVVDEGGDTPLMVASRYHHAECVAEMLRLGADARRIEKNGRTALHWVASGVRGGGGGAQVVRLLVAAGCDAAVRDNDGRTVVEHARTRHDDVWAAIVEKWVAAALP